MDQALGIQLDARSDLPLYAQIVEALRSRIRSGALPGGTRLPPTRTLAAALATHRNTVVRAFDELQAMGLIAGHVGRGSYVREDAVRDDAGAAVSGPAVDTGASSASGLAATAHDPAWGALLSRAVQSEPLRRMQRLGGGGPQGSINLARMQPSPDLMPHEDFRRCLDHVLRTLGPDAMSYAPSQGVERLRDLVARELSQSGMPVQGDDLIITSGSQQAIDLIARALVNPGDVFLTEARTYSGALNILGASCAEIVGVPSDADGPIMEALAELDGLAGRLLRPGRQGASGRAGPDLRDSREARDGLIKGFYLMPNSRNPTGTSISAARREAIVAWARAHAVPLVEDDYGADLELDDDAPRLPALRSLASEVLHLGTFSKKLMPALRVGFVVCPPALRGPLTGLKHAMDLGTSALLQHALAEFLDRGLLRSHLQMVRQAYRERRDALASALRQSLPREVTFEVPDRGVVLWLALPPDIDPEAAYQVARIEGVMVSPSTVYSPTLPRPVVTSGAAAPMPSGLRLTYCNEPPERLREGARRLGRALASLVGKRGRSRVAETELVGA